MREFTLSPTWSQQALGPVVDLTQHSVPRVPGPDVHDSMIQLGSRCCGMHSGALTCRRIQAFPPLPRLRGLKLLPTIPA